MRQKQICCLFLAIITMACSHIEIEEPYLIPMHLKATERHDVLCIGNSITYHAPSPNLGWYSAWGMAATKPEKDYCHVLESMLKAKNTNSTVTPLNIAAWERNPLLNIDSLLGDFISGKDIIIIRIGENVEDVSLFQERIYDLLATCLRQTNHIVVTGCFWYDDYVDRCLKRTAMLYGLNFIPLTNILHDNGRSVISNEHLIYYDTSGNPYHQSNSHVMNHPNDEGMRMIAETIYRTLFQP